ncbi:MAG: hypothetical protein ABIX01_22045 [Chitinophagaceae bacterium]
MSTSISLSQLESHVFDTEVYLEGGLWNLWQLIKLQPAKWYLPHFNHETECWIVAIFGSHVLWYNDIEEGFNISTFTKIGVIADYCVNQSTLLSQLKWIQEMIISGVPGRPSNPFS